MRLCDHCETFEAIDRIELWRKGNISAYVDVCRDCKTIHDLQAELVTSEEESYES